MKITDYCVLRDVNVCIVEKDVVTLLARGWQPYGQLFVIMISDKENPEFLYPVYYQAMVKTENSLH